MASLNTNQVKVEREALRSIANVMKLIGPYLSQDLTIPSLNNLPARDAVKNIADWCNNTADK